MRLRLQLLTDDGENIVGAEHPINFSQNTQQEIKDYIILLASMMGEDLAECIIEGKT